MLLKLFTEYKESFDTPERLRFMGVVEEDEAELWSRSNQTRNSWEKRCSTLVTFAARKKEKIRAAVNRPHWAMPPVKVLCAGAEEIALPNQRMHFVRLLQNAAYHEI